MVFWMLIIFVAFLAFVMGIIAKSGKEEVERANKASVSSSVSEPVQQTQEKDDNDDHLYNLITKLHAKERSIWFYVVGGIYRTNAAQEEYCMLTKGEGVKLKMEPDNIHDRFAVKVMSSGKHIGYVPREESRAVFQVLKQDCVSECIVKDNHYANTNDDPDLMEVLVFIKPEFIDKWRLGAYFAPDED